MKGFIRGNLKNIFYKKAVCLFICILDNVIWVSILIEIFIRFLLKVNKGGKGNDE